MPAEAKPEVLILSPFASPYAGELAGEFRVHDVSKAPDRPAAHPCPAAPLLISKADI